MRALPLALALLVAGPSAAAPRFLVVPLEVDDDEGPPALFARNDIYDALLARGLPVVGREEREGVDLPIETVRDNVRADAVRALLLEARAQMRELEVDRAGTALKKARAMAMRLKDPALHTELIGEILLERANLLLARGAEDAAARDLQLLAVLDKERDVLHPGLYPPALTNAYKRERDKAQNARVPFVVVARPSASVFVDNAAVRAGVPTRLCPGLHWVSARAPGKETVTQEVRVVDGGALVTLNLFVPEADAGQKRQTARLDLVERPEDIALYERLAALSGADAVIGVGASRARLWTSSGLVTTTKVAPLELARFADENKDQKEIVVEPPSDPPPEDNNLVLWVTGGVIGAALVTTATAVSLWYLVKPDVDLNVPRPVPITCCSPN